MLTFHTIAVALRCSRIEIMRGISGLQEECDEMAFSHAGARPHGDRRIQPDCRPSTARKLPATLRRRNTARPSEAAARPKNSGALLRAIRYPAFRDSADPAVVGGA